MSSGPTPKDPKRIFDKAFIFWLCQARGKMRGLIVFAEIGKLWVEVRVVAVGFGYGDLGIIYDRCARDTAAKGEGIT